MHLRLYEGIRLEAAEPVYFVRGPAPRTGHAPARRQALFAIEKQSLTGFFARHAKIISSGYGARKCLSRGASAATPILSRCRRKVLKSSLFHSGAVGNPFPRRRHATCCEGGSGQFP